MKCKAMNGYGECIDCGDCVGEKKPTGDERVRDEVFRLRKERDAARAELTTAISQYNDILDVAIEACQNLDEYGWPRLNDELNDIIIKHRKAAP